MTCPQFDAEGCNSIDEWIDRLDEQTPLEVITSSGTTGTLSILPKDKHGAREGMVLWKICLFQTFGVEPTAEQLNPAVEVIWPNYASGKLGHLRIANMLKGGFTGGDESRFHALYSDAIDTDLMFLASKMRAAASRGELDRLVIDPALAARKDEFIAMQMRQPQELDAFFTEMSEKLRGKRVFMIGTYNLMYDVAKAGLERGIKGVFAEDSVILTGGGLKGFVLPDGYMDVIREFLGVDRIQEGYGFSEQSAFHFACTEGRYHVQPWVIPFVLDPETSEPFPRKGRSDRPRRRLRRPAQGPLGRGHLRRRGDHRLGSGLPVWPDQRRVRARHHPLQREDKVSRTIASPALRRTKSTTRPSTS